MYSCLSTFIIIILIFLHNIYSELRHYIRVFVVYYVLICFILNIINVIASVIDVNVHYPTNENKLTWNLCYLGLGNLLSRLLTKSKQATLDLYVDEDDVKSVMAMKDTSDPSSLSNSRRQLIAEVESNLIKIQPDRTTDKLLFIHHLHKQDKHNTVERNEREQLAKFWARWIYCLCGCSLV